MHELRGHLGICAAPVALSALLAGLWLLFAPPTPDLAAQVYRTGLFEEHGFTLFNAHWYAGHHTPGYSLLFPPLAALVGPRVLGAMAAVPRHLFVEEAIASRAYEDTALPIGFGQTISQPYVVAVMTAALGLAGGERILEIGTGSGYQAAILAELTDEVYSVEIVPELAGTARGVLDALGYADIRTDLRDGYLGWPAHAPYDAIIVTAAPDHLPQPLVEQLEEGTGRMVIPIGPVGDVQSLWLVTNDGGEAQMEWLLDVSFVPLVRQTE